jgi:hypothetical protein
MNGKTNRKQRTVKGIQRRIDKGCRQRHNDRLAAREMRAAR